MSPRQMAQVEKDTGRRGSISPGFWMTPGGEQLVTALAETALAETALEGGGPGAVCHPRTPRNCVAAGRARGWSPRGLLRELVPPEGNSRAPVRSLGAIVTLEEEAPP